MNTNTQNLKSLHPFENFAFNPNSKSFVKALKKGFSIDGLKDIIQKDVCHCPNCETPLINTESFQCMDWKRRRVEIRKDWRIKLETLQSDWQYVKLDDGKKPFVNGRSITCTSCGQSTMLFVRAYSEKELVDSVVFLPILKGIDYKLTLKAQKHEVLQNRVVKDYNGYWFEGEDGQAYETEIAFFRVYPKAKKLPFKYYHNDKIETKLLING